MPQDDSHLLEAIDRKLAALLALATHRLLLEDPELANPRPRSIDQILNDVGLSQGEIANLLGKTPQAVSYMLAKE